LKTLSPSLSATLKFFLLLLVAFGILPTLHAKDKKTPPADGDPYKVRIDADWWYDNPSVSIKGNGTVNEQPIDFDKTFGFSSISTYDVQADWHFTRRQHFLFVVTQYSESKSKTLAGDVTFRGVTYTGGTTANANLKAQTFAPGYEFDLIRNERGHLGIIGQFNLEDISAKINGTGFIVDSSGNQVNGTYATSGSVLAPIPVFGPEAKYLFIKGSNKYYVDGFVKGMYFFGYGNFVSTRGTVGANVWKGLDVVGGYQMGSRLAVHGTASRLDIRFTQQGPILGLAYKW
jgi:hypothetical protein